MLLDEVYDDDYIDDTEEIEVISYDDDFDLCNECYCVEE